MIKKNQIVIDNKIGMFETNLFDNKDRLVGTITTLNSLLYVRIQIKERELKGYYLMYLGKRIDIGSDGKLSEWPEDFLVEEQLLDRILQ